MFLVRIFKSYCDGRLTAEVERLRNDLENTREALKAEVSKVRILGLEIEKCLEVIERDRRRVEAETKAYVAKGVHDERQVNDAGPRY